MLKFLCIVVTGLLTVFILRAESEVSSDKNPPPPRPIDPSSMDPSVKPADDFFLYAAGGWIKRTEIPPEYSRWGSFNELIESNNDALHDIAETAENTHVDPKLAPEVQKVGDYYASGMDEKTIEATRTKPLDDEFKNIDAVKDRNDLLKEIAHLHTIGVNVLFNFGSGQDAKDSAHEIAQAVQGGLGLPDRDYYTKTDEASKKLRDQYVDHVAKMLTLLGEPAATASDDAKKILVLETKLAEASRTRVELRDPQKNYNKMSQTDLQALTPDWTWADYFKETTLRGTKQIKPRWKRVVISTDQAIGEALGKLYVGENFPPEAKARALELINNLKEALSDRIKTLEWMEEATKQEALKKLAAFTVKIGYPDKWRDYSLLKIDQGPFVLNAARAENLQS